MNRLAYVFCVCLSLTLCAGTNLFYGTIQYSPCRQGYVVSWTNPPIAYVVEHSLDMSNWYPVLLVSRVAPSPGSLEYDVMTNGAVTTFMRLRQVAPIVIQ
jgi:hypothetical protein